MTENETIPGAFKALITGYGIIGLDYAYIPATSVPELSLKGDKPFTIFTTICFKNTQNGSILEQKDMFQMGIMDGLLYVAAIDWCAIKFSEYKVTEFVTDHWYSIAIVYDGKILSAWLEGEKKDSFKCKAPYKGKAEKELCIGKRLDAYFKNFLIFDRALSGNEISSLTSGEETLQKESLVWFDFSKYGRKSQSPNGIKITMKYLGRIVIVYPSRQFRFTIDRRYQNIEQMLNELFETSKTVNFTGRIGYKPEAGTHHLAGRVSLGTSKPIMCEVEGEIVTVWESIDIAQTNL